MSDVLRWKLVVGCLVIAALSLPDGAAVLAHDLGGPYCTYAETRSPDAGRTPTWTAFDPRTEATTVTSVDAPRAIDEGAPFGADDAASGDAWDGARN